MHRKLMLGMAGLLLLGVFASCSRSREYELSGQVLAVDRARREITVQHGDIRGFMPGMTMPFKVKDESLLEGRAPGDLITATLVVKDSEGYLSSITMTGRAPVAEPAPPRAPLDLLEPGSEVPDFEFIDANGKARRLREWRGAVVAVTFIYTRCPLPDFCPLMDRNLAAVQRQALSDPDLAGRFHLLSVSFDPGYDTPAVLHEHAAKAGANADVWTFATGDRDDVERFASRFGVSVMREDPAAIEIVHNLRTAVIDPDGRLTRLFNGNERQPWELLQSMKDAARVR